MDFTELSEKVYAYTESCMDDALDELNEQLVEEGTNWDSHNKFKELAPKVRNTIKEAKALIKAGKGAEANKKIDSVISDVEEFQKKLMDYDDSFGEAICGNYLMSASQCIRAIAAGILTLGIGSVVVAFKDYIDGIVGIIEIVKKDKNISMKVFNSYRTRLVGVCKRMISSLKKAKADVIEEANSAKAEGGEETKESVDTIDLQLDIFEAYESGNITEEDRDNLLGLLED